MACEYLDNDEAASGIKFGSRPHTNTLMDTSDQIPRSLVAQTCYSTIDGILKDLKLCSRRIYHAQAIHADEVQLLQRVYYRNKNQHRDWIKFAGRSLGLM